MTGSLDSYFQRQTSEGDTRQIMGWSTSTNLITVASIEHLAADTGERLNLAFWRNAEFNDDQLTVTLSGSAVTLSGRARTWGEHERATEVAWRAPGVTAVTNNLRVTY